MVDFIDSTISDELWFVGGSIAPRYDGGFSVAGFNSFTGELVGVVIAGGVFGE